jgi:hypothetical protein
MNIWPFAGTVYRAVSCSHTQIELSARGPSLSPLSRKREKTPKFSEPQIEDRKDLRHSSTVAILVIGNIEAHSPTTSKRRNNYLINIVSPRASPRRSGAPGPSHRSDKRGKPGFRTANAAVCFRPAFRILSGGTRKYRCIFNRKLPQTVAYHATSPACSTTTHERWSTTTHPFFRKHFWLCL